MALREKGVIRVGPSGAVYLDRSQPARFNVALGPARSIQNIFSDKITTKGISRKDAEQHVDRFANDLSDASQPFAHQ